MSREEQIEQEALSNCNDIAGETDYKYTAAYEGFIEGAKWADEHPEDGLVKIDDVRKFVREWLNTNFYEEKYWTLNPIYWGGEDAYLDELIDDLCKAMEECL